MKHSTSRLVLNGLIILIIVFTTQLLLPFGATAQNGDTAQLTIVAPALNVRSGPGISYPAFDFLVRGEQVVIIGYDVASDWWQVQLSDEVTGWVSGGEAYVSVSGDISNLMAPATEPPAQPSQPNANSSSTGTIVFQTAAGGAIYAVNDDGTNLRYLTTGMDPVLSPDGQWVAFTRWETSQDGALGNVWLINANGTDERVIHEYVHNPRAPSWSGDGTKLVIGMQHGGRVQSERICGTGRPPRDAYNVVVTGDRADRLICYSLPPKPHWGLRMIDVTTGAHEDLPAITYSFSPTLHPAYDQELIYDGDEVMARDEGLMGLNLEANITWRVTTDPNDHSPEFSPDGSKLAVSYRQDDHWEVHVMNADGSGRQRLTRTSYAVLAEQLLQGKRPHSYSNAAPAWSPDGSQLVFLSNRTGPWEIWLMNADGSNQQPLLSADMLAGAGISLSYMGVDEQMLSWR